MFSWICRRTPARLAALVAAALALGLPAAARAGTPAYEDFRYLPDDTRGVLVVHMDRLLGGDVYRAMREKDEDVDEKVANQLRPRLGVDPADVQRVTVGSSDLPVNHVVTVVRTRRPVGAAEVAAALAGPPGPDGTAPTYRPTPVGRYTIWQADGNGLQSFCVAAPDTLLLGEAEELRAVLERKRPFEPSRRLRAGLRLADPDAEVVFAADVAAYRADGPTPQQADDVNVLAGWVRLGAEPSVTLTAVCRNGRAAEETRRQMEGLANWLREDLWRDSSSVVWVRTRCDGKRAQVTLETSPNAGADILLGVLGLVS
jgi:hypothetical protein